MSLFQYPQLFDYVKKTGLPETDRLTQWLAHIELMQARRSQAIQDHFKRVIPVGANSLIHPVHVRRLTRTRSV